jgi:hypothetical protein
VRRGWVDGIALVVTGGINMCGTGAQGWVYKNVRVGEIVGWADMGDL